jgi:hypothetical protein
MSGAIPQIEDRPDAATPGEVERNGESASRPIGLIAGSGDLPLLVARGMRRQGHVVHAVGFAGVFDPALPPHCDSFQRVGLLRLSQWARLLRARGVSEAVMVGKVSKRRMYDPFKVIRYLPDWRTAVIWYRRLRHDRRSPAVLRAVADELQRLGVTLIDSTTHIPEHLATAGLMTHNRPSDEQQRDIDFGWPVLCAALEHDFGQALTVCDCDVIAVEAIEGTDEMIMRTGTLCRRKGWTLLKGARQEHDRRADVPTVGVSTVENVHAAGGRCLALAAGDVILLDKPAVLRRAEELGVAIVGVTPPWRRQEADATGGESS